MARYNYAELMKELKTFEEIVREGNEWCGLLRNHPKAADFFYDQSHGELHVKVGPDHSGAFSANLFVRSIDDGSIVLLGPSETQEKAMKRAEMLLAETEEWGGWIPTEEKVKTAAEKTGCYWNR